MIPAGVAVGIDKAGGLVEKATQKISFRQTRKKR